LYRVVIGKSETGKSKDLKMKHEPIETNQGRNTMNWQNFKRLIVEEDGMEMVEWAIVGVVFAVAAAGAWTALEGNIDTALGKIETEIAGS